MNLQHRNPDQDTNHLFGRPTVIPTPRTPERLFNGWGVRL